MTCIRTFLCGTIVAVLAIAPAFADQKHKGHKPKISICAPIPNLGHPQCPEGEGTLPMPSTRVRPKARESSGVVLKEGVSLDGKTNFNENRFGEAPLQKLVPRPPSKSSTNGGAQVDFQF